LLNFELKQEKMFHRFTLICLFSVVFIFTTKAHLPEGFSDHLVWKGSGYDLVIGLTFDESGRMFFWKKAGSVFIIEADGTFIPTPVLNITEEVGNYGDHGLTSVALDPDFLNNGYVYLIYVVDRHHLLHFGKSSYNPDESIDNEATIGRVTRFQLDKNNGFKTVTPNSRKVLIGDKIDNGIPILYLSHGADCVAFGNDGSLLVSTGDGTTYEGIFTGTGSSEKPSYIAQALDDGIVKKDEDLGAYRSQYLHSLSGKILRIDPATGDGLSSNPFYDADNPQSAASRVWALGFRNPFRIYVRQGTGSNNISDGEPGTIYVGDVGSSIFEELNVVTKGGQNYGWPIYEGHFPHWEYPYALIANPATPNPLFGDNCDQEYLYFQNLVIQPSKFEVNFPNPCNSSLAVPAQYPTFITQWPLISYANRWNPPEKAMVGIFENDACTPDFYTLTDENSPVEGEDFNGSSSIPGFFYQPKNLNFPEAYHNKYFHADYRGWIKIFDIDEENNIHKVKDFLLDESLGITSLVLNPVDGCMYYTDVNSDVIRKIGYEIPQPPTSVNGILEMAIPASTLTRNTHLMQPMKGRKYLQLL